MKQVEQELKSTTDKLQKLQKHLEQNCLSISEHEDIINDTISKMEMEAHAKLKKQVSKLK